ncbi:MAG: hypothetical protein AAF480_08995, partial [Actinomycetota bacterium]
MVHLLERAAAQVGEGTLAADDEAGAVRAPRVGDAGHPCVFDVEQKAIACGFTFFANIGDARVSLLRDTRIFDAAG